MLFFLILNLIVILNTYLITRELRFKDIVDSAISFFLFYIAQIIFFELALGILGILRISTLITALTILLLFNYLFFRKASLSLEGENLSFNFESKILLLGVCVFLGFFIVQFWNVLINPPLRADSLAYHLTDAVNWLKNGNLNTPFIPSGTVPFTAITVTANYYPFNGELLFLWSMLPLKNALFASVTQAPFYFISILAMYSILKKLQVSKVISLIIAITWILIPNIFKHLKEGAYIDIMCVAIFLMTINYLLILKDNFNVKNSLLLGITCGIFLGLKTLNIFWLAALFPLFIYIVFINIGQANRIAIVKILSLIVISFLVFSAYPFIRNFIMTKNIFFPIRIEFFGKIIMPGYVNSKEYANLCYPASDFKPMKLLFSEGLGFQLFAFVLPGTFIPLFISLLKKNKRKAFDLLIYFIPFLMFVFIFFSIRAYWTRYMYPFLAAGFISLVLFLNRIENGKKYIYIAALLSILGSIPELSRKQPLVFSLILSFFIYLFIIYLKKISFLNVIKKLRLPKQVIAGAAFILLFFLFTMVNNKYEREQYSRYVKFYQEKDVAISWKWLNDFTGQGKRIAYVGRPETYPLFGSKLKNDVFYVSINDKPVSLVDFGQDGQYRKEKSYSSWLKNLKDNKADLIFIYQDHYEPVFPIEDQWAMQDPQSFKPVYTNPKIKIYSFLSERT
jgi:hypothetical protein